MPVPDALDQKIRTAAFIHVRRMLELRDPLTSEDLARGFLFRGERIPLVNPQRGIFKPQQMKYLVSIKTVVPLSCLHSTGGEGRSFAAPTLHWFDPLRFKSRRIPLRSLIVAHAMSLGRGTINHPPDLVGS